MLGARGLGRSITAIKTRRVEGEEFLAAGRLDPLAVLLVIEGFASTHGAALAARVGLAANLPRGRRA